LAAIQGDGPPLSRERSKICVFNNVIKQIAERLQCRIYRLHVCLDREGRIGRHPVKQRRLILKRWPPVCLAVIAVVVHEPLSSDGEPFTPEPNRNPSLSCRSRSQFRSGYDESPHQCDGTELDLRRGWLRPFPREGNTLSVIGYRSGHAGGRPAASWSTASSYVSSNWGSRLGLPRPGTCGRRQ
jgi:hypothetical protein